MTHGGVQRCGLPQNCANTGKAARVPAKGWWGRRRPGVVTCALWWHRRAEVIWQSQRKGSSQQASPTGASPSAARVQPCLPGGPPALGGGGGAAAQASPGAGGPATLPVVSTPRPSGPRCPELMDTRATRKYEAMRRMRSRDSRRAVPRGAGGAGRGRGHASCL